MILRELLFESPMVIQALNERLFPVLSVPPGMFVVKRVFSPVSEETTYGAVVVANWSDDEAKVRLPEPEASRVPPPVVPARSTVRLVVTVAPVY